MHRIAVINTLPIPSGVASVNRMLSYAKGLVEIGDDVTVLSSANSNSVIGEVDGVKYNNMGNGRGMMSLLLALHKIIKVVRTNRYDSVILMSNLSNCNGLQVKRD